MSRLPKQDFLGYRSLDEEDDVDQVQNEKSMNNRVEKSTALKEVGTGLKMDGEVKRIEYGLSQVQSLNRTVNDYIVNSKIKGEYVIEMNLKTPRKTNSAESQTPDSDAKTLSYANVVQGMIKCESYPVTSKADATVTDDLSLTSHLDVFHVASPLKDGTVKESKANVVQDEDTIMYSPCKEEIAVRNMKRPFQLIESPVQKPQPRSGSDNNIRKIAKSKANSDVHSWAIEEAFITGSDDGGEKSVCSPNLKRELEVNPEILSRRQKQIDYGKNTLGYDRYIKIIPKHKRRKEHPKTPPKHLKMSRRTWDGLIKNWRLKLHRWDQISESDEIDFENANFDEYLFSSEEASSYDSSSMRSDSTPSTPKHHLDTKEDERETDRGNYSQNKLECSKELWSDSLKETSNSNNDEFLGCEILTENYAKAS